jgi:putative ABC transport system permease protein
MTRRRLWYVVAGAALVVACSEGPVPSKEPPAGSYATGTHQVRINGAVTSVQGATVTPVFFKAATIGPLFGRLFVDVDHQSSSSPVVVLSHSFWTERFGAAPGAIGRQIEIDAGRATIVGIAPVNFTFPEGTQLWLPERDGPR